MIYARGSYSALNFSSDWLLNVILFGKLAIRITGGFRGGSARIKESIIGNLVDIFVVSPGVSPGALEF